MFLLSVSLLAKAQIQPPRLEVSLQPEKGWTLISSSPQSNTVMLLEASPNCADWAWMATLHDVVLSYPDLSNTRPDARFYRAAARARQGEDDWKNQLIYPADRFCSTNSSQEIRWVKFAILLSEPDRVYYDDSKKFAFHYDFATQRLAAFVGMDHAAFDAVSLYRTNRQIILGSVLYPPGAGIYPPGTRFSEYGVQFAGIDLFTPEEIGRWFELVKATVYASNGAQVYYMPSFEQAEMTSTNGTEFEDRGIQVGSPERWISGNNVYSPGWAFGRLKFFPAVEIVSAFGDGRLQPSDVLLTDGVPADTPVVAGIISLAPSTPNSHTALLSQSFGTPFVYLADSTERERVSGLTGHKIILRATIVQGVGLIKILDVEGQLDSTLEAELLSLKAPEPILYSPKESYGALSASTDTLGPADIRFFGGKAANYGILRRSIPASCPPAIAFSFDLWDSFLDQQLPGGFSLRAEITRRLDPFTNYPPDIVSLKTNLAAIRDLFTRTAQFSSVQQQAITNTLGAFDPLRKIRFRSSTNIEDSEHFTGAGLYDSFSGCLMDDLDGDALGPCQCDPTEPAERGVFRALKKVYASFYNDDAFLERLRHGVNEAEVGMAVLAHHSFPDQDELANGVATPKVAFTQISTNLTGDLVTQLGAESVTNPDGTSIPEIVSVSRYNSSTTLTLKQRSSLVPLGAYVLDWQSDYRAFVDLFTAVASDLRQYYPARSTFWLDFEYKKDANLGRVIKQVRQVPQPGTTNQTIPFLLDEPGASSVQQRGATAFASHRLKSIWQLRARNLRLSQTNLTEGIYREGTCEFVEGRDLQTLSGPLDAWPNASHSPSGNISAWTTGTGADQRFWQLETTLVTNVSGTQSPILTPLDLTRRITVTYSRMMPTVSGFGTPTMTNCETALLQVRAPADSLGVLQERSFQTNGLTVQTSYYWPKPPGGVVAGYTAPLLSFVQTQITGLTSEPLVLTNYFSQTYGAFHHNFYEEFIFEPRLEPGVSPSLLEELNTANIQLLYVFSEGNRPLRFYALGLDGKLRSLY